MFSFDNDIDVVHNLYIDPGKSINFIDGEESLKRLRRKSLSVVG